jgi:hypothetical protein
MKINKVIIWGHHLHSHTHSYIHNAFYIAFKHTGYDTHWYDDKDNIDGIDFSNSLFITEHNVDKKIPKRNDCLYFVHMLEKKANYKGVNEKNLIIFKCAYRDMARDKRKNNDIKFIPLNDKNLEFYTIENDQLIYYILWGTDLFPEDIQKNIDNIDKIKEKRTENFLFVGSITEPWKQTLTYCSKNKIPFKQFGATFNKTHYKNLTIKQNEESIQASIISPAFQDKLQIKDHYIPCRIFKNISYGRMGITNNLKVYELFDKKIVYANNINNAIEKGIEFENNYDKNKLIELMTHVKDNHTYIQRIESLKEFISKKTSFIL